MSEAAGGEGRQAGGLLVSLKTLARSLLALAHTRLDIIGSEIEEQRASLVGGAPALVVRVEEPVSQELELEVAEPVVVEELPHLGERPRLQHVLEVGVPEPDALEPDARGLLAAIAKVEEAPLPPDVHLDRPGRGPVQPDEVVASAHSR